MNRRAFLGALRLAPIAAIPAMATAGVAFMESYKAHKVLQDISMTKDGVIFTGCHFNLGGNLQMMGNHQTVHSCYFQGNYQGAAISVTS